MIGITEASATRNPSKRQLERAGRPRTHDDVTLHFDPVSNAADGAVDVAATMTVEDQPADVGIGNDGQVGRPRRRFIALIPLEPPSTHPAVPPPTTRKS